MIKKYLFILSAVVLAVACKPKVYNEENSNINVKVNQEFQLELASSPSTGYQWHEIESIDSNLVKLKLVDYKSENPGVDGASGFEIWKFEAVKAGETQIKLHYWRPWDKSTAGDTIIFNVKIH